MWTCGWWVSVDPQVWEHGRESNAGAEVLGVVGLQPTGLSRGGDGDQGLGGGFEQQVIDDGLVVIGDVGDRPR